MKKICTLLAVIILFAACHKSTKTARFTYSVYGIQDITVSNGDSTDLPLSIALLTGTKETVNLTVTGLPAGATAVPAAASGMPPYATTILLKADGAATGTYPVTITASSVTTTARAYTFNLTVAPMAVNCASAVEGIYSAVDLCSPNSYTVALNSSATTNQVFIDGLGGSYNVTATLNCSQDSIIVPSQANGGYTVKGTGYFTATQIVMAYTVDYSNCTVTMTK